MSIGSGKRIKVAEVGDLPIGEGRVIEAEGRTLALFNVDGTFYAIDNTCSHRGGPLADGEMEGNVVSCPWHAWRWDVTTGANAVVQSFPLEPGDEMLVSALGYGGVTNAAHYGARRAGATGKLSMVPRKASWKRNKPF